VAIRLKAIGWTRADATLRPWWAQEVSTGDSNLLASDPKADLGAILTDPETGVVQAGFGKAFMSAGDLEWGARMHDDLVDAVDWAVDIGVTTADKVAIMGASYGGYATLVGLTFTPDRFACGVSIVGPSNLNTFLEAIPPYWTSIKHMFHKRVGDPATEEGRQLLHYRSPLMRVDAIKRPLLIGQGANDPRIEQSESDQIVSAIEKKRSPSLIFCSLMKAVASRALRIGSRFLPQPSSSSLHTSADGRNRSAMR
jgi:dienelactone hydrolase